MLSLAMLSLALVAPRSVAAQAYGPSRVVVGFTVTESGPLVNQAQEQAEGLRLWARQVNAGGGIAVDRQRLPVELKWYDDEGDASQIPGLYRRLVVNDKVDFLMSPYSSALAAPAAEVASELGMTQIVIGAAADAIFDHGLRHIYQVYAPATVYLNGVVDMLRAADPTATRVAFLYRDDLFASDVVEHARDYAASRGIAIVYDQSYDASAVEFWDYLPDLAEAGADLIVAGGLYPDSLALVTQMAYVGVPARMLVLLVAPTQPSFAEIGEAAIGVLSPTDWEPLAPFSPEAAASDGLAFYGPTGSEFTRDFLDAYGYAPSYLGAGGYVAGLLLERSIEQAGSVQREAVERALAGTDVATFFGPIRFALGGLQIAHSMSYVQWQPGPNGPERQVIAPTAVATAPLLYPRP